MLGPRGANLQVGPGGLQDCESEACGGRGVGLGSGRPRTCPSLASLTLIMAVRYTPMGMEKYGQTGTAHPSSSSMAGGAPPMKTLSLTKRSWGTGIKSAMTFAECYSPNLSLPSHYFESTYSADYSKEMPHSTRRVIREPHSFPGHQPELEPPPVKRTARSCYMIDYEPPHGKGPNLMVEEKPKEPEETQPKQ